MSRAGGGIAWHRRNCSEYVPRYHFLFFLISFSHSVFLPKFSFPALFISTGPAHLSVQRLSLNSTIQKSNSPRKEQASSNLLTLNVFEELQVLLWLEFFSNDHSQTYLAYKSLDSSTSTTINIQSWSRLSCIHVVELDVRRPGKLKTSTPICPLPHSLHNYSTSRPDHRNAALTLILKFSGTKR